MLGGASEFHAKPHTRNWMVRRTGNQGISLVFREMWGTHHLFTLYSSILWLGGSVQRHHIHSDLQAVFCAPEQNPANRADVAIIPAPSQGDVPVGRHAIVRGVEVHPSKTRTPCRTPGMRGVRSYQAGAARRR